MDALVRQFQKGDKTAFKDLYDRYAENICGVIHTIIKNRERSEELCQDVFVKIWENSASYDPSKGRFFTWILNIARNAAIDELRSKTHKNQKKNLQIHSLVDMIGEMDAIEDKPEAIGVKSLLKGLKEKCLLLIDLLYFRGYTQKEAAEELKAPVGTIKTRIRSCILQIRKNMKG